MDRIAPLKNPVQEYNWGSRTFIQKLLGDSTPKGKPLAELWMGTHPYGPSEVLWKGQWTLLSHLIEESPERILGSGIARRFRNRLPFLFKVIAAAKPLSIQAHPNKRQAAEGFQKEESRGIGRSAPERNFRDRNHKPEIFCALKPSWVLKGFRGPMEIRSFVKKLGLSSLLDDIFPASAGVPGKDLQAFFMTLIELDAVRLMRLISQTVRSINKSARTQAAFSWVVRLSKIYPNEAMVLSPLFLNLIHLQPGEAVMINPGTLHAYLQGAGVELMANSDNVIRAGLTSKTKDIGELPRIVNFGQESAKPLKPRKRDRAERFYPSETKDFALSVISATKHTPYLSPRIRSLEILICVAGRGRITDWRNEEALSLTRGVSLMVPASVEQYSIEGRATIYKAAVPLE